MRIRHPLQLRTYLNNNQAIGKAQVYSPLPRWIVSKAAGAGPDVYVRRHLFIFRLVISVRLPIKQATASSQRQQQLYCLEETDGSTKYLVPFLEPRNGKSHNGSSADM